MSTRQVSYSRLCHILEGDLGNKLDVISVFQSEISKQWMSMFGENVICTEHFVFVVIILMFLLNSAIIRGE